MHAPILIDVSRTLIIFLPIYFHGPRMTATVRLSASFSCPHKYSTRGGTRYYVICYLPGCTAAVVWPVVAVEISGKLVTKPCVRPSAPLCTGLQITLSKGCANTPHLDVLVLHLDSLITGIGWDGCFREVVLPSHATSNPCHCTS